MSAPAASAMRAPSAMACGIAADQLDDRQGQALADGGAADDVGRARASSAAATISVAT